jgi:hypothetical protein
MQQQEDSIDFDLRIDDRNRILFALRNLTVHNQQQNPHFDCDQFNENECHHNHSLYSDLYSTSPLLKCTYCRFYDLIKDRNSTLKISSDTLKMFTLSQQSQPTSSRFYHFNVRFRKQLFKANNEWLEFLPFKRPYALIAFAECATQADLYKALVAYEREKERCRGQFLVSRLFIDFHAKHESSDEFISTLNLSSNKRLQTHRQSSVANLRATFSIDELSSLASIAAEEPTAVGNDSGQFQESIDLDGCDEPVKFNVDSVEMEDEKVSILYLF